MDDGEGSGASVIDGPHRADPVAALSLRAASGWIEEALDGLGDGETTDAATVHLARRRLARVRATLRLVRPGLDPGLYARESAAARGIRRRLSPSRDRVVALRTVRAIAVDAGAKRRTEEVVRELAERRASLESAFRAEGLPASVDALRGLLERSATWQLVRQDPDVVIEGAARAYRRGRRAWHAAADERSREALHDLRKRTKDVRYQLELLGASWGREPARAARAAHRLSDALGAYLDLEITRDVLTEVDQTDARRLKDALEARIGPARRRALSLARPAYPLRPEGATARLRDWAADAPAG